MSSVPLPTDRAPERAWDSRKARDHAIVERHQVRHLAGDARILLCEQREFLELRVHRPRQLGRLVSLSLQDGADVIAEAQVMRTPGACRGELATTPVAPERFAQRIGSVALSTVL
jgi:hypothetical protein